VGKPIRIEGHTDSSGSSNANLALSQKRAEAVRDALVASGVEASRITVVGLGSERPVAANDTAEGRARNRRVDIILEEEQ
jgi:outer membrane protein OmpA-like peptidoglycan-associated protein